MFNKNIAVPLVFLLLDLLIIAGGVFSCFHTKDFIASSVEVSGRVIALRGSDTLAPVVEYKDLTGRTAIYYSSTRSNPPEFAVGEELRILYQPSEPFHEKTAKIKSILQLWFVTIFATAFGGFFALFGALACFFIGCAEDADEDED